MPSAEVAIRKLLTTGSPNPVAAIVGTRVYPNVLPQNPTLPAIRFQRISTPRSQYRTLDGHASYASPRFQIDCYAADHAEVLALAQAVYGLLEGFNGTVDGLRIDAISAEDEGGEIEEGVLAGGAHLYRQRLDVFVMHAE